MRTGIIGCISIDLMAAMKNPIWAKNLLFLTLLIGGVSVLTIYLMAADRIKDPESYSPRSQTQTEITAVAARVDRA